MGMRTAVALSFLVLIGVSEVSPGEACSFSCKSTVQFAPASGERIPPGATIYVFPELDTNVVVRVFADGRPIWADIDDVESTPRAISVSLGSLERGDLTVEVSRVSFEMEHPLGTATYQIDEAIPEPAGDVVIDRVTRSSGAALCGLSFDLLWFWPDVRAHAYRLEWARSEQAYRDGDRRVAIIPRSAYGNAFAAGRSICSRDDIPSLSDEDTLFVGVAAVGYREWGRYHVPIEPTRIDVGGIENEERPEHRPVESDAPEPVEGHGGRMVKVDLVPGPSVGRIISGVVLGLLLGWPLGLLVGRRFFRRRRVICG